MNTSPDYLTRADILTLATREVIDLGSWPFLPAKPIFIGIDWAADANHTEQPVEE